MAFVIKVEVTEAIQVDQIFKIVHNKACLFLFEDNHVPFNLLTNGFEETSK